MADTNNTDDSRDSRPQSNSTSTVERAVAKLAGTVMNPDQAGDGDTKTKAPPSSDPKSDPLATQKRVEIDFDRANAHGLLIPGSANSLLAEEFRLIKRPMLVRALEKDTGAVSNSNLIMVSSARPNEGKTFTAANLALSIAAEPDLSVLLIDADVARASVPEVFGFEAELGLVDLIADESLWPADVTLRTQIDNLSILPAGRSNNHATELLASERMSKLVDGLAGMARDRIVIFDSPPVLVNSIASVMALHVGQVLFVVEADHTTESALENALTLLSSCKNISLLLNKSRAIPGTEKFGSYYYR
jgi:exopolysaccharide/PEP-CTERM locus tyrosine autokinase